MKHGNGQSYSVFVGTYATAERWGIFACSWDEATGQLRKEGQLKGVENPSFLARHPKENWLYAVSETAFFGEHSGGSVASIAWDPETWKMEVMNVQPTGGGGPCHVSLDSAGKFVLAANYGGGSFAAFPVLDDGKLGERCAFVQHTGHGHDRGRQEAPHVHSVIPDPQSSLLFVSDLGLDRISLYRLYAEKPHIETNATPWSALPPGSGPRHFVLNAKGTIGYGINELNSTVTKFSFDRSRGTLHAEQTISTLPPGWQGHNQCSDIHLHPNGRFLYAGNRGHDSITLFEVDVNNGSLQFVETVGTEGKWPRNFAVDPSGRYVLAANEESDNITTFAIDQDTGQLTYAGHSFKVDKPVCVIFVPMP